MVVMGGWLCPTHHLVHLLLQVVYLQWGLLEVFRQTYRTAIEKELVESIC